MTKFSPRVNREIAETVPGGVPGRSFAKLPGFCHNGLESRVGREDDLAALKEDRMLELAKPRWTWTVLAAFLAASLLACAPKPVLRPRVQSYPSQFPYSVNVRGVAVAVVPFDGLRGVYDDPASPKPARPDFDWLKAGVRPTRIILANDSQEAVLLDPAQVTCIDNRGVAYKAYTPREAGDAVVSSEAFGAHLRRGLKGALVGAALGAGVGAALGAVTPYRGYAGSAAAAGAAWGGALGGLQGLFVGVAGSRADLERRARRLIEAQQLPETVLSPGTTRDGLVFFPALPLKAVRLVLAGPDRQATWPVEIEVSLPGAPGQVFPPATPPKGLESQPPD